MKKYRLLISDEEGISYNEYETQAEAFAVMKCLTDTYKYDVDGKIDKGFNVTIDEVSGKALIETATEIVGFAAIFPICK
jgi:hypothetical protein